MIKAPVLSVLLALGCAGLVGFGRFDRLEGRLGELETRSGAAIRRATRLEEELRGFRSDLEGIRNGLLQSSDYATRTEELALRLLDAEQTLAGLDEALCTQDDRLAALAHAQASFGPSLETRLLPLETTVRERWESLREIARSAAQLAGQNRELLGTLDGVLRTERDLDGMWTELVGPVVQLAGEHSVGSGVLLESRRRGNSDAFDTFILTAWHVVRDIQEDAASRDMPVPVAIFERDGSRADLTATLLRFDPMIDAALLRLDRDQPVAYGARLAPRQRVVTVRTFDSIYAVGCPLGNDPIPTPGEVSSAHHEVDGATYWMINAPTFIGNSGGGIFDSDTHELLGIFSKIYNYGSLRPTIVPHMGLVTPLTTIYDWLADEGYAHLAPDAAGKNIHPGVYQDSNGRRYAALARVPEPQAAE